MYKILFVQPSQYNPGTRQLVKQRKLNLPGLVFPLLAALTPPHWHVSIVIEITDDIDFDADCDLVGIGAMGHAVFRAIEIAQEFKKRGKTVFFGGYMASMALFYVREFADSVVVGDAEKSYLQLLNDYENTGKIRPVYDDPLQDLSGLPLPHYEIFNRKKNGIMLPVQAARGCPHLCSFCSIACLYKGRYMTRPVEEVLRDIRRIKALGYPAFYLIDDNIVGKPQYLEELARRIKPLKMIWASQCSLNLARNPALLKKVAASGCRIMSFGLESITQEGLDKLDKGWVKVSEHETLLKRITRAGIMVTTEMMLGTDSDTAESIRETFRFVMRTKIAIPRFYILTPMPGSRLYDEYKARGKLMHEQYELYTGTNCVHYPEKITPRELNAMYAWLNKKLFTVKNILLRTLFTMNFLRHPLLYTLIFFVNLHYRANIRKGELANVF